jgi:hypothetical protein
MKCNTRTKLAGRSTTGSLVFVASVSAPAVDQDGGECNGTLLCRAEPTEQHSATTQAFCHMVELTQTFCLVDEDAVLVSFVEELVKLMPHSDRNFPATLLSFIGQAGRHSQCGMFPTVAVKPLSILLSTLHCSQHIVCIASSTMTVSHTLSRQHTLLCCAWY